MIIAQFIEERRKSQKVTVEELSDNFGISPNTYRTRLKSTGFDEAQILAAGKLLGFKVLILPDESNRLLV